MDRERLILSQKWATIVPQLTRRRDPDAQQETWLIHYDDVRVGVIAERVGNPDSTPDWEWACGFYPGSDFVRPHSRPIVAERFDQARDAFEAAWRVFPAKRTEADFEEYRRGRAFHAWKRASGRPDSSGRRRLPSVAHNASAALRSALMTWMTTSTPCTWRPHEIRRAPPLCRS